MRIKVPCSQPGRIDFTPTSSVASLPCGIYGSTTCAGAKLIKALCSFPGRDCCETLPTAFLLFDVLVCFIIASLPLFRLVHSPNFTIEATTDIFFHAHPLRHC